MTCFVTLLALGVDFEASPIWRWRHLVISIGCLVSKSWKLKLATSILSMAGENYIQVSIRLKALNGLIGFSVTGL